MRVLAAIAKWLFVLGIPLFLFTTTLRLGVGEMRIYEYGIDKYNISETTGIEKAELLKVYRGLIYYFNSDEESAQVMVAKNGKEFGIFNKRELAHLKDVKGLIQLGYHVQEGTLIYIIIYACVVSLWGRRRSWKKLARVVRIGSGATIALMFILGVGALFGFQQLFIQFHLLSFSNTLWILDPTKDYLLMMFPGGFFYDAALFGTTAIAVEALILGGIAQGFLSFAGKGKSLATGASGSGTTATGA